MKNCLSRLSMARVSTMPRRISSFSPAVSGGHAAMLTRWLSLPVPKLQPRLLMLQREVLLDVRPDQRRARGIGDAVDRGQVAGRGNDGEADAPVAVDARDHFPLQRFGLVEPGLGLADGTVSIEEEKEDRVVAEV